MQRISIHLEHTHLSFSYRCVGMCMNLKIKSLSPAQQSCMSEIFTLLKLVMLMPATNAVSERSASTLCRVKTYLCSFMTQLCFNNFLVLHVHEETTDTLQLSVCLNEFVSESKHSSSLFGISSELFFHVYVSVSNLQMKLASEKQPDLEAGKHVSRSL